MPDSSIVKEHSIKQILSDGEHGRMAFARLFQNALGTTNVYIITTWAPNVWTQYHFVPVPGYQRSGTKCEQRLTNSRTFEVSFTDS